MSGTSAGSAAAPTWFNLGDQDLATHFYRTARLAEGATLTAVTDEVRRAFGLPQQLLPMSDHRVTTMVTLADEGVEVPFQEYFVQRRHGVPVSAVRFDGVSSAALSDDARRACLLEGELGMGVDVTPDGHQLGRLMDDGI